MEACYIHLNAGISLKSSCIPPVNTGSLFFFFFSLFASIISVRTIQILTVADDWLRAPWPRSTVWEQDGSWRYLVTGCTRFNRYQQCENKTDSESIWRLVARPLTTINTVWQQDSSWQNLTVHALCPKRVHKAKLKTTLTKSVDCLHTLWPRWTAWWKETSRQHLMIACTQFGYDL